jgi:hypothetical protein
MNDILRPQFDAAETAHPQSLTECWCRWCWASSASRRRRLSIARQTPGDATASVMPADTMRISLNTRADQPNFNVTADAWKIPKKRRCLPAAAAG